MLRLCLNNLGNRAGADRSAAFADGEPQPLLQRHRRDQLISSETLSPGITISTPAGNSADPVTSVVRK